MMQAGFESMQVDKTIWLSTIVFSCLSNNFISFSLFVHGIDSRRANNISVNYGHTEKSHRHSVDMRGIMSISLLCINNLQIQLNHGFYLM